MQLKVSLERSPRHTDVASAIGSGTGTRQSKPQFPGWLSSNELISAGDDHLLLRGPADLTTTTTGTVPIHSELDGKTGGGKNVVAVLPETLFPTDIHFVPGGGQISGKQSGKKAAAQTADSDLFVLTSTDGHFYLISKSGRVEKHVQAHTGAVISARWSPADGGSSLLTVGEDGQVKVWSRAGMLRSKLTQVNSPVSAGAWAPTSDRVLYTHSCFITVRSLQAGSAGKELRWKAHGDGVVVLCADWSVEADLIVTGAEDRKYKVWSPYGGQLLYTSSALEHPVTSVAWQPAGTGSCFAVGSYDLIALCDKAGWMHCTEHPAVGSVYKLCWSADGTQLGAATASGHVPTCALVQHELHWGGQCVRQAGSNQLQVLSGSAVDTLDLKDRLTKMAFAWGHLVVATAGQLYIYSAKNWNTPVITDLREGSVSLIKMAPKLFLVVEPGGATVMNYEGRTLTTLRSGSAVRLDSQSTWRTVALCDDTLAIREATGERRSVVLLEPTSGRPLPDAKLSHTAEIVELVVDFCGPLAERRLAFVDRNNDLFVAMVKSHGVGQRVHKLSGMVTSCAFNDTTNMLLAVGDNKLMLWTFPACAQIDVELLPKTVVEKNLGPSTQPSELISFTGWLCRLRRSSGASITVTLDPYSHALHSLVNQNKWDQGILQGLGVPQAIRLCRRVKEENLWAALAAMATYFRSLTAAQVAYGAIDEAERVYFLSSINAQNDGDVKKAELALANGQVSDAERILLQGGHTLRAILLNISLYKWKRALELALKNKREHVDIVVGNKQRYLQHFGWKETDKQFLQCASEIEIDWEHIEEKIETELDKG